MEHELLKKWQENKEYYKVSEVGSGTMGFVKEVLDSYFGLRELAKFSHAKDLFGNDLLDHIYTHEGKKRLGDKARWDFMLKMNGKKIVVEVEAYESIEKGMKQIDGYMTAESTIYGIVTDGWEWRFFNEGDSNKGFKSLTLEELLSEKGKAFLDNHYNTYDYYLNRLKTLKTTAFDLQPFHTGLITIAEAVVSDFRHMGLFDNNANQEKEKVEIQTAYSLIIQFLLIKIIQNKRNIQLIDVKGIVQHLEDKNRQGIFEEALTQIEWLGNFYESYHNQQESLIQTIIEKYKTKFGLTQLTLDAVRPFLDLYQFIFSFDFKEVKQDLFGAVYENYLKELYKNDDTKKGQVFTPPEIVEFMLDEIGYTIEYIKECIMQYGLDKVKQELDDKGTFNIEGLSLIDPACGSGTFLYKGAGRILGAIYKLRKDNKLTDLQAGWLSESLIVNNIVGFDIEAFPLYLAEMNILQTLLFFNIDPQTGKVLNMINKPIKIFSTQDSISEFSDLQSSMMQDLEQIVLNEGFANSLLAKRDNATIFNLKADIQQFDPDTFVQRIEFQLACKELESPVYVLTDKNLITKKTKTFWDKYGKSIMKNIDSLNDLKKYLKENHELVHEQFRKRWKVQAPRIEAMKKKVTELVGKQTTKRMKFDFVIANPPYIAYNSIPVRDVRQEIGLDMNNVFGVNLHSTPDNPKKYSPKPNLYSYFNALAYRLVKDDGQVCFIVPEGFVAYDCNAYFLTHQVSLQTLMFFNTKVFVERGITGGIDVCTSAIIYKFVKGQEHSQFKLVSNELVNKNDHISEILKYLSDDTNIDNIDNEIAQEFVQTGLSILKKGDLVLSLQVKYKKNSDDIMNYLDHDNINKPVKDNFYIDIGYGIDEKNLQPIVNENGYYYFIGSGKYYSSVLDKGRPKDKSNIGIGVGCGGALQGYSLLDSKYKIVWNKFMNKGYMFYFEDREVIRATSSRYGIGSENKEEILYLFGILNSSLSRFILESSDTGGGVEAFRVTSQKIKEQIRVPIIDSQQKQDMKKELIKNSETIITLCKNSEQHVTHRSDITTTKLNIDKGIEEIVGLKPEYAQILGDDFTLPVDLQAPDSLPEKIVDEIGETSLELKKLEDERDEIVKKLYNVDM